MPAILRKLQSDTNCFEMLGIDLNKSIRNKKILTNYKAMSGNSISEFIEIISKI